MKVKIKVPATSANLGPGFDIFGLAVGLHNEFLVEEAQNFGIVIKGLNSLPKNKENLFYQSFIYPFEKLKEVTPQVRIEMNLGIPQGRGFGSSATAVVGGLLAANAFLHNHFSFEELLPMAVELERGKHPDNVTPALFGGLVIVTSKKDAKLTYIKIPFPQDLKAVYFVPDFAMDTITGRKLMPTHYHKNDVVFNTGRVALFLAALQSGNYHLLGTAMEDRIHQPARTKVFPLMPRIIAAALSEGAYGAALSGGGSSIIALAGHRFKAIARNMVEAAAEGNISGSTLVLDVTNTGSEVKLIEL